MVCIEEKSKQMPASRDIVALFRASCGLFSPLLVYLSAGKNQCARMYIINVCAHNLPRKLQTNVKIGYKIAIFPTKVLQVSKKAIPLHPLSRTNVTPSKQNKKKEFFEKIYIRQRSSTRSEQVFINRDMFG